jgi:hypothetical protein
VAQARLLMKLLCYATKAKVDCQSKGESCVPCNLTKCNPCAPGLYTGGLPSVCEHGALSSGPSFQRLTGTFFYYFIVLIRYQTSGPGAYSLQGLDFNRYGLGIEQETANFQPVGGPMDLSTRVARLSGRTSSGTL